ncbi:MAG: hypothetical protein ACI85K_002123 [Hyphomicrobiaceae bacterium]
MNHNPRTAVAQPAFCAPGDTTPKRLLLDHAITHEFVATRRQLPFVTAVADRLEAIAQRSFASILGYLRKPGARDPRLGTMGPGK